MTLANKQIFPIDLGPLNPVWAELILGAILFALTFLILAKGILPKINRTLAEREDAIDGGTDRADGLRAEATAVREQYEAELAEARHDAARIRSQATEEGSKAIAAARAEGIAERDGILAAGHQQIAAERETAERELAGDVDSWAHALAGRIVGEPVGAQRA
ncbi:F0F1 ATP synthase subunit B family protein [Streptomyces laurentii]|jgi:F-type H+-transporting ATPase subunit b|uniref:F0F1 ATP synthase subunit B family protein n=1 Tax=Streptomyces laurentii TaxID=39478 RepID=UPI003411ACCD